MRVNVRASCAMIPAFIRTGGQLLQHRPKEQETLAFGFLLASPREGKDLLMTQEGDLILTHIKNKPAFFARIENIDPDVKPDWFQVKMLVLQVPLVTITWILREAYINGEEFTMGGHAVKLVKVVAPEASEGATEAASSEFGVEPSDAEPSLESGVVPPERQPQPVRESTSQPGKVVSLMDRRKKISD